MEDNDWTHRDRQGIRIRPMGGWVYTENLTYMRAGWTVELSAMGRSWRVSRAGHVITLRFPTSRMAREWADACDRVGAMAPHTRVFVKGPRDTQGCHGYTVAEPYPSRAELGRVPVAWRDRRRFDPYAVGDWAHVDVLDVTADTSRCPESSSCFVCRVERRA